MNKILVVGGTGEVGQAAVKELLTLTSAPIIIGGRNQTKGELLRKGLAQPALAFQLIDIYNEKTYKDKLSQVALVLMCLSPKTIDFSRYCLENGIHYVDISASSQAIEPLRTLDSSGQAVGLLGVGICPGVSTLLVKELAADLDSVDSTEISLLLGMGEHYGTDALCWLLDNLSSPFYWSLNGTAHRQQPFTQKKRIPFLENHAPFAAYTFNLADQQIVTDTLHQTHVTTYLSLNDRLLLSLLAGLTKLHAFSLLRTPWIYRLVLKLAAYSTTRSTKTTDIFSIHVRMTGQQQGEKRVLTRTINGQYSSTTTGKIAAEAAVRVLNTPPSAGVYYLHELFHLDDFSEHLDDATG